MSILLNSVRNIDKIIKLTIFSLILLLFSYNSYASPAKTINIAVAANMLEVTKVISESFTKHTNIKVNIISSSSGKLYHQIINGAPYHMFISADVDFPNKLVEKKLTIGITKIYAKGILVLWFKQNIPINKLQDLHLFYNKYRIAIANPKIAPYGKAAVDALSYLNTYDKVKHNLIITDSINQINQLITTNSIDIAFTSKSSVVNKTIRNQGSFIEVPKNFYNEILQGAVILKYSENNLNYETKLFYDYLFSKKIKLLMKNHGYIVD